MIPIFYFWVRQLVHCTRGITFHPETVVRTDCNVLWFPQFKNFKWLAGWSLCSSKAPFLIYLYYSRHCKWPFFLLVLNVLITLNAVCIIYAYFQSIRDIDLRDLIEHQLQVVFVIIHKDVINGETEVLLFSRVQNE